MVPHYFSPFISDLPLLKQLSDFKLLKEWSLAAVYRATHSSIGSFIIKWGGSEMTVEGRLYKELVMPLKLSSPKLYDFKEKNNCCILILEDIGQYNLEQSPQPINFIKAATELAKLRALAIENLHHLSQETITAYTLTAQHFHNSLHDISLKLLDDEQQQVITKLKQLLPDHLNRLYQSVPLTIVHHDFMAKNLMLSYTDDIVPIDWSIAYLSPHLGDLYNLIKEAKRYANVESDTLTKAYLNEYKVDVAVLTWEIKLGGICWLIKTLRWLTYGGTEIIPGSDVWVTDLFGELKQLQLELMADCV